MPRGRWIGGVFDPKVFDPVVFDTGTFVRIRGGRKQEPEIHREDEDLINLIIIATTYGLLDDEH